MSEYMAGQVWYVLREDKKKKRSCLLIFRHVGREGLMEEVTSEQRL